MTILEMLEQSALLAILGMAIVFFFLWILIICVNVTGSVIRKMGWDKDITASLAVPSKRPGEAAQPGLVAAITAAVQEYRKTERND
jgi:oxaloacetate decarboxylase gamma subunit